MAAGFRPGNVNVPLGAPIDAAHGADPAQPQTLLDIPDVPVIEAIRDLWQSCRKPASITLVLDCSGSMQQENRIGFAREGAVHFIRQLSPADDLSILAFNNELSWLAERTAIGQKRDELIRIAQSLLPAGGTSLYDAVADAAARQKADNDPARIHAIVVLSDGADEDSRCRLDTLLEEISAGGEDKGVRIFTIAYGSGAKFGVLEKIASTTRGKAWRGDRADITRIFRDIAVFF